MSTHSNTCRTVQHLNTSVNAHHQHMPCSSRSQHLCQHTPPTPPTPAVQFKISTPLSTHSNTCRTVQHLNTSVNTHHQHLPYRSTSLHLCQHTPPTPAVLFNISTPLSTHTTNSCRIVQHHNTSVNQSAKYLEDVNFHLPSGSRSRKYLEDVNFHLLCGSQSAKYLKDVNFHLHCGSQR